MPLGAPEDSFERLQSEIAWVQRAITVYGKTMPQPRLTAWYGDPGATYGYSGIRHDPLPWNDLLMGLRGRVEALLGVTFNSVLLNLYRSGRDSIGFHSDDERELGPNPVIASLSFGASRTIVFRHRAKKHQNVAIDLDDNTLLLMMGETQQHWQHGIEKTRAPGARINLTFRHIMP